MEENKPEKKPAAGSVGWGPWASLLVGIAAFLIPQVILGVVIAIYAVIADLSIEEIFTDNSFALNFYVSLSIALMGTSIIWIYTRTRGGFKALGFKEFSWKHLAYTIPAYFVYFAVLVVIFLALEQFISPDILDEAQDVGFEGATTNLDKLFAFGALVIIAPIYEEILFRGFAFQGFAKRYGFWPAAIVTSAMFGIAHGQLNVAVDTLVLGIVASWLLWHTKSIYPAILLHGIKNAVAFVVLFVI